LFRRSCGLFSGEALGFGLLDLFGRDLGGCVGEEPVPGRGLGSETEEFEPRREPGFRVGDEFFVGRAEREECEGVDGAGGDGGEIDGNWVLGVGARVQFAAVVFLVVAGQDVEFEIGRWPAEWIGWKEGDAATASGGGFVGCCRIAVEDGAGLVAQHRPLVGAGPGEVVALVLLVIVILPFEVGAAEDADDGEQQFGGLGEWSANGGERVVSGGIGLGAGLAPLAEGGEGGAAGAGFYGAAGKVGGAEAVELESGVFEDGAAHVDEQTRFEFGVNGVLGFRGGGQPSAPGIEASLGALVFRGDDGCEECLAGFVSEIRAGVAREAQGARLAVGKRFAAKRLFSGIEE